MKATMESVTIMSVESNDFINRDGAQVYFSNLYIYNQENSKVIELAIRDNYKLSTIATDLVKKNVDVAIDIKPQKKGGYSFFINVTGISKNGKN